MRIEPQARKKPEREGCPALQAPAYPENGRMGSIGVTRPGRYLGINFLKKVLDTLARVGV